jgi:uncharacterized membrane protein (DUF2068 family)
MQNRKAICAVALFEGFKGLLVLLAGFGALSLLHRDVGELAASLITHAHLNPASRYPRIFLDAAEHLSDANIMLAALGGATYAAVRLTEAFGLWHEKAWAEWLAALSGGLYVPFEVYEFYKHHNWLSAGTLLMNVLVVVLMLGALRERKRKRTQGLDPVPGQG